MKTFYKYYKKGKFLMEWSRELGSYDILIYWGNCAIFWYCVSRMRGYFELIILNKRILRWKIKAHTPLYKEKIICAAVWFADGKKYEHQPINIESGFVVCGRRHYNCFITVSILRDEDWKISNYEKNVQGFITSNNRFLNNKDASEIAYTAGQMFTKDEYLFSEHLY